jgi:TIR domain
MPRVLISYRREDSAGQAGRLSDMLAEHFGPERVFMDVDTIGPGEDFAAVIRTAVTSADVVIALIGHS